MNRSLIGCRLRLAWSNPGVPSDAGWLLSLFHRLEHALTERGGRLLDCFSLGDGRIYTIPKGVADGPQLRLDVVTGRDAAEGGIRFVRMAPDSWRVTLRAGGALDPILDGLIRELERVWSAVCSAEELNSASVPAEPAGGWGGDPSRASMDALGRHLWPFDRPPETVAEVEHLLRSYRTEIVGPSQGLFLAWELAMTDGAFSVDLWAEHPRFFKAVEGLLLAVGLRSEHVHARLLPDEHRDESAPVGGYGQVRFDQVPLCGVPGQGGEIRSELLLGEPVWVLTSDPATGWLLVHSADGYWGWVMGEAVIQQSAEAFHRWFASGGRAGWPAWEERWRAALNRFRGACYVWGGRARTGLDCSGFVQGVYAELGIHLPRDARQQARCGRLVGTRWDRSGLCAGDLLFFLGSTGAITHTGLALGRNSFVHLSPPQMQVCEWAAADPDLIGAFVWAKRILDV
ncbi:MAG: C40 family peptidase [Verrucomicrobiota bacterium]|jgi:hypothetical protein